MIFLALALLTLLAGVLYSPSNGSSTGYRIPRVMHWLAEGYWHWIHTFDARTDVAGMRINIAGNGFEWLLAPLILLTHSDRFLFLPNWFSFLLLPGLIFSVFRRLGVRLRVAWWWMWILPSGWIFIMQAGSTINDAFATAYALAAVDFALRARENKNIRELWLGMLAAALATGVKQTNILLVMPALIAIWPCMRLLFKRPLSSAGILAVCLLVSALPIIIANLHFTGTWSGVPADSLARGELHSPFWGVVGNIFILAIQNLKPPVFPFANSWNATMKHFVQTPFGSHFAGFQDFGHVSFGVAESTAALGAGICILIFISLFAARHYRRAANLASALNNTPLLLRLLRWTPWAMLLVFMAKVGTFENGRLLASYYFFLFPSLLTSPGQSVLVRRRWWQSSALLVMAVAVMLVIISRDRPLFPSQTVLGWLESKYPNSKLVSNISKTYAETPAFEEQRRFLKKNLPPDEMILGFATAGGEGESLLWLPYGHRRVQRILPDDTPEQLRSWGVHYVVVQPVFLLWSGETLQQWIARYNGILVKQWEFTGDPYFPPERSYLVRLQNS